MNHNIIMGASIPFPILNVNRPGKGAPALVKQAAGQLGQARRAPPLNIITGEGPVDASHP